MSGLPERLRNMGLDTCQEAADEIERLRDVKRTCQCAEDDQCMFAKERDEAREAARFLNTLTSGWTDNWTDKWPWLDEPL